MNIIPANIILEGCAASLLLCAYESTVQSYYKEPPPFSLHPQESGWKKPYSIDRFGPVGIGIELTLPASGFRHEGEERGEGLARRGARQTEAGTDH